MTESGDATSLLLAEAHSYITNTLKVVFFPNDIAERLRKLPTKATGSDGIPNCIYSFLADTITAQWKE